jgi:hypothetical protein
MFIPLYSPAQVTTIATNTGGKVVAAQLSTDNMLGYGFYNFTTAFHYVYDESGILVDILPPLSYVADHILTKTRFLQVVFDPTLSGQTAAFTPTNAWQVYGLGTKEPQQPQRSGQL